MVQGIRAVQSLLGRSVPIKLPLRRSILSLSASIVKSPTIRISLLRPQHQRLSTASHVKVLEDEKGDNQTPSESLLRELPSNAATSIGERLPSWLRPYQVQVIVECMKALDSGLQRIGVSSPTGSGKTVMLQVSHLLSYIMCAKSCGYLSTHLIPLLLERGSFQGGSVLILVGNIGMSPFLLQRQVIGQADLVLQNSLDRRTKPSNRLSQITLLNWNKGHRPRLVPLMCEYAASVGVCSAY
jgi:hypothetical protein